MTNHLPFTCMNRVTSKQNTHLINCDTSLSGQEKANNIFTKYVHIWVIYLRSVQVANYQFYYHLHHLRLIITVSNAISIHIHCVNCVACCRPNSLFVSQFQLAIVIQKSLKQPKSKSPFCPQTTAFCTMRWFSVRKRSSTKCRAICRYAIL